MQRELRTAAVLAQGGALNWPYVCHVAGIQSSSACWTFERVTLGELSADPGLEGMDVAILILDPEFTCYLWAQFDEYTKPSS